MITDSLLADLAPADIGFDHSLFVSYRDIQLQAIEWACEALEDARFVGLCLPTGAGKSLAASSVARLMKKRAVFLTITKALQAQYARDFARSGLVDVQGKANYQCVDMNNLNCDGGSKVGCRYLRGKGCEYEKAKAEARNADQVVTNYAYWLGVNDKAAGPERTESEADFSGENPVELLVLDEAHEADSILASYISCALTENELKRFGDWPDGEVLKDWKFFANDVLTGLEAEIQTTQQELIHLGRRVEPKHVAVLHQLERLASKLTRISQAQGDDWIVERENKSRWGRQWKFDSVFPGKYAEKYLFCGVKNVLLMSATLKPKTMNLLGLKTGEFKYRAWKRIFAANRHPVYMVGAKKADGKTVRVDYNTSKEDMLTFVRWLDDEWFKPRLDRKGLVLTVSYERQKFIMEHSRYSSIMVGNTGESDSDTAVEAAERVRTMTAPALLVSPSFGTGWDFPGEQCEYVLLVKVPFESMTSKVLKARVGRDKSYADYRAMQKVEQAIGRGMRFDKDRCEVGLMCGHFEWFLYKNKSLAQDWFVDSVRRLPKVPPPPKALKDGGQNRGSKTGQK